MKRTMYLLHRWLGVALCLLMALWFVSGLVMVYVGYPKLTTAERLAALPALDAAQCRINATPALSVDGKTPESLRLTSVAGQPLLVAQINSKRQPAFHADGTPLAAVGEAQARAAARAFAPEGTLLLYQGAVQEDAWTHSRALDAHRPLHRVLAGDTLLYVSSATGEVVRDATATERRWGWIGTWLHWWYLFRGIGFDGAWTQFIIYASLLGSVLTLLGMVVGLWRWRFAAPYKSGARTPYRQGWMRWHHTGGLLFGLGALTFVFSGLMSMNPWKVFDASAAAALKERQAAATRLDAAAFALPPCQALQRLSADGFAPRELVWRMVDGRPWYLAHDATGAMRLLAADAPDAAPQTALDAATLQRWGRTLGPAGAQATADWITHEDIHYYRRAAHTMTGHYERPLPVLRLRFDDPAATWLYLDPASGAVVQQSDAPRRASRWLFAFLHSWDAPALLALRPLWDGWMWLLSLGGLLISASGVVIGLRRLRLKLGARAVAV